MSVENTAFSSSGEDAITRTLDVEVDQTADMLKHPAEFDAFYEIERIAREIEQGDFKRVSGFSNLYINLVDYLLGGLTISR